ncbi:LptF/LptG family permease [Halobacteriovorax sp. GB3]|uniref:LptF/LptG family permease n=1 Tax=Halobacteriovorax sp. GB3 TaxID=2719615 RepID=UPI00235E9F69|nr:LptF/LptG family permease [Halobacteriovorax sp. GB3]MDD0854763.1 LptF/LptG family permease [Halobacteriovorax sp. GB3]
MHSIKKLIITEWIRFFIASFIAFLLLVSVGSLISGFLRSNITAAEVLLNYFVELPITLNRIIPISCLIASLFSINKLKNRNELTAIFASGYSRKKYVVDVFQVALVVSLLQFFVGAYMQPYFKKQRHNLIEDADDKFRNLQSKGLKASTIGSGLIWYKSKEYYFSFLSFDSKKNKILSPNIFYYNSDYHLSKKLIAKEIQYNDGNWVAKDIIKITKLNETTFPITQHIDSEVIKLEETLADFKQIEADITTLSYNELLSYINNLTSSGLNVDEYTVLFLEKISNSVICIIFALIACVPIFNPNRRNSSFGKSILFVFVFTIVYWLVNSYAIELGINSKINPYTATFSVPVLFLFILSFFFLKNRKLN